MNGRLATPIAVLAIIALVAGSLSAAAIAQAPKDQSKNDAWGPVRFLVGKWKGTSQGKFGPARVQVTGTFVLGGKYLHLRTKSVSKPQGKGLRGETHEDWEIISHDHARDKFVLRQFNSEGFVNRYVLEDISDEGNRLVFVTEAIENGPPGLRARTTYVRKGNDAFSTVFELAPPGQDFTSCVTSTLTRRK